MNSIKTIVSFLFLICFVIRGDDGIPGATSTATFIDPNNNPTRCTLDNYKYGQWVPGASNCGLKDSYTFHETFREIPQPYPWSKFCWKPYNCSTVKYSPTAFCDEIAGKRLLFVGDSILYSMYVATFHQMEEDNRSNRVVNQHQVPRYDPNISPVCGGRAHMTFVRNDQLSVSKKYFRPIPNLHVSTDNDWVYGLNKADIIIMNKGHHVSGHEKSEEEFELQTQETAQFLKTFDFRKPTQFFFVTTSPSHPFCRANSQPNTSLLITEPNYLSKVEDIPDFAKTWGWHGYHKHDQYIISLFQKSFNVSILDIAPMSFLRPDGHAYANAEELSRNPNAGDCLHYRLPAAVDSWVHLLYNSLLLAKT